MAPRGHSSDSLKLKNFLPQDTLDAVRNSNSSQRILTIMLLELRADIYVGSNFLGIDYYNRVDFVCFMPLSRNGDQRRAAHRLEYGRSVRYIYA